MIQSNISGLAPTLSKIVKRIEKLENARPLRVIGGLNVRTTQLGKDWIINADPAGDSAPRAEPCPLDILLQKHIDADWWDISVRLGTIGGYAPDNWDHITATNGEDSRFIVAVVTATEKNITTVTLEARDNADGCIKTMEGNPPAEFELLIGALIAREKSSPEASQPAPEIVRTISCGSVSLMPKMVGDNCWTWDVGSI